MPLTKHYLREAVEAKSPVLLEAPAALPDGAALDGQFWSDFGLEEGMWVRLVDPAPVEPLVDNREEIGGVHGRVETRRGVIEFDTAVRCVERRMCAVMPHESPRSLCLLLQHPAQLVRHQRRDAYRVQALPTYPCECALDFAPGARATLDDLSRSGAGVTIEATARPPDLGQVGTLAITAPGHQLVLKVRLTRLSAPAPACLRLGLTFTDLPPGSPQETILARLLAQLEREELRYLQKSRR